MPSALIVGSGPAAAGTALALCNRPEIKVTVLDIGARLEAERQSVLDAVAASEPAAWQADQLEVISRRAAPTGDNALPEKRSFGSDYPFADFGQRAALRALGTNPAVVSGAYGGFSNVWGAQVMPFSAETLEEWPISFAELEPHYRAVLGAIPFAGEEDDLAERFPLIASPTPLPALSPRTALVLNAYRRHRAAVRGLGVTVGHARLALNAHRCVRCGLCMTGCPYGLVYSAAQTFDALRRAGRISYHSGVLVHRVVDGADGAVVHATELSSRAKLEFTADRCYVAAGAVGTTRIVLNSLERPPSVTLGESVQFALPALSLRSAADPRPLAAFTLNQFNVVVELDERGVDLSQLHFYPYNPSLLDALPRVAQARPAAPVMTAALSRLSVALGYLPSWASPRLRVTPSGTREDALGEVALTREHFPEPPPMLGKVLERLRRAARYLDLWPIPQKMFIAAGAKSYHFGGSFPMASPGQQHATTTDRLGRLAPWRRVHLVDGSVFPTVPATTFTLTVMANAHRIATESLAADGS